MSREMIRNFCSYPTR